ncbi:MAG TPA: MogA/MoaB family molybdenum cofactor biosynthesis protein [Gemmatimonadaceae bacterium]|nr:MogA/MoaB family molybdenum cofactor biosynthesis protein [Gemmatimonadaceae bacterium]
MRIAVLTISDAGARGERVDTSGDAIVAWAAARGDMLVARALVPDDTVAIVSTVGPWCDADAADLVVTTGGTGLGPRDVTPEATRALLDREAPGIAERIRALGMQTTANAALSRGVAGARGRTLIVNLAGSTPAVREGLAALDPIVNHAVKILRGDVTSHEGGPRHTAPRSQVLDP